MSKARQTQCPSCGSTFQVNSEQLEIASGAVRCGNCLNVFQADDYFTDAETGQTPAISPTSTSLYETTESEQQESVDESWALELLKDLDDETEPNKTTETHITPPVTEKKAATSTEALPTLNANNDNDEDTPERKDNLSDTFQNIDSWSSEAHDQFGDFGHENGDENDTEHDDNPDSEEWAKKMLEEDALDQSVPSRAQKTETAPRSKIKDKSTSVTDNKIDADPFGIGKELDEFVSRPEKTEQNLDAREVIATIELEPVELDLNEDGKKKVMHLLGESALILAAVLLLGIQYFTYNFHSLSKDPTFRPWYAKACASLDCSLPRQSDIKRIRGKNLVIRTHPDIRNALLVDIVMTNHANFSQKLPLLELAFTDINGFPVAKRKFKPSEYLSGALLKLKGMPAKTPMHISLTIQDPGAEAINYHVNFQQH